MRNYNKCKQWQKLSIDQICEMMYKSGITLRRQHGLSRVLGNKKERGCLFIIFIMCFWNRKTTNVFSTMNIRRKILNFCSLFVIDFYLPWTIRDQPEDSGKYINWLNIYPKMKPRENYFRFIILRNQCRLFIVNWNYPSARSHHFQFAIYLRSCSIYI